MEDSQIRADTTPAREVASRAERKLVLVVSLTYLVLVLLLWLPFGPWSGMGYETTLVLASETRSWWEGFFYSADPLRRYESIFYHSGYLLGQALTFPGDFAMYQVVYALLWWARGILAFAIVRRLLPQHGSLAYLVGALVLVHASDNALNWVGQLNQFGMIFWMLLSFLCLVVALQAERWWRQLAMTALACTCAYLSLWSYESQLFIVSAFPIVAVAALRDRRVRHFAITGLFLAVPGWYAVLNYLKYTAASGSGTYQASVMRADFSAAALLADLGFNVRAGLAFWNWGASVPYDGDGVAPAAVGIAAAITVLVCWAWLNRADRSARTTPGEPSIRAHAGVLLGVFVVGASLLVLSFPVYLMLTSARALWRTQFLSGFGAALVLASLAGSLALLPLGRVRRWLPPVAVAIIAGFGVAASYRIASLHYLRWERHRDAIAQVLRTAPSLRPETLVMLIDVPPGEDPFGDNMWFDVALRLAYPGVPVAGGYYLADGSPAPSLGFVVEDGQWTWNGTGFAPEPRSIPFENTVIIDYDESGRATIVERVPDFISRDQQLAASYAPRDVITALPPAESAALRYLDREPGMAAGRQLTAAPPRPTTEAPPRPITGEQGRPKGGIEVIEASYGLNCANAKRAIPAGNVTPFVQRSCNRKNGCRYSISVQVYGDPAFLCAKDFSVRWRCDDGQDRTAKVAAEADGKQVELTCPPDGGA